VFPRDIMFFCFISQVEVEIALLKKLQFRLRHQHHNPRFPLEGCLQELKTLQLLAAGTINTVHGIMYKSISIFYHDTNHDRTGFCVMIRVAVEWKSEAVEPNGTIGHQI
jgi:hypothetical protein